MQAHDLVSHRKAALLLHALPAKACKEVLLRLEAAQRVQMNGMLSELRALGIPPGRDWLAMLSEAPAQSEGPVARAWHLSATQVVGALDDQSPDTIAALMAYAAWPWKNQCLSLLPVQLRVQVQQSLASHAKVSPAVAGVLIASLLTKRIGSAIHSASQPAID